MILGFFVEGPARAKQSFRVGGRGRGFQTAHVKSWQSEVGWAAQQAIRQQAIRMVEGEFPMSGPFRVELTFKLGDRRRIDSDNLSKAVLDAMNGIVWEDDDQVVDLHIRKVRPSGTPGVIVEITALAPDFKFDDLPIYESGWRRLQ